MTETPEPEPDFLDYIAKVVHEANRAVQRMTGETENPAYPDIEPDMQESLKQGIVHALEGASAEELHGRWCEFRLASGWVYGPVKDASADPPTHPDLVPYDELPPAQKLKDDLFRTITLALFDTGATA